MMADDIPAISLPIMPEAHLIIQVLDRHADNLGGHLTEAVQFVSDALGKDKQSKVICHCFAGMSRSATVVAAYLIASQGIDVGKATEYVLQKRRVAQPSKAFLAQLKLWAAGRVQS